MQMGLDPRKLVVIDETSASTNMTNRLVDRGILVRRFNIANGHLNAGAVVSDAPFVVGRLEVHFAAPSSVEQIVCARMPRKSVIPTAEPRRLGSFCCDGLAGRFPLPFPEFDTCHSGPSLFATHFATELAGDWVAN
jgi:hypothetical protein